MSKYGKRRTVAMKQGLEHTLEEIRQATGAKSDTVAINEAIEFRHRFRAMSPEAIEARLAVAEAITDQRKEGRTKIVCTNPRDERDQRQLVLVVMPQPT